MSIVIADPQIAAIHDDGTEQGIVRAAIERSELVDIPLAYLIPSGTTTKGGTGTQYCNLNMDVSGRRQSAQSVVFVYLSANKNNYCTIPFSFAGRTLGLRCSPDYTGQCTVFIDGIAYPIPSAARNWKDASTAVTYDQETIAHLIAEDLPDCVHQAYIHIVGSDAATTVRNLYSVLVERRIGYEPFPLVNAALGIYAVKNATPVPINTLLNRTTACKFVTGVDLCNPTAGAIVCSITYNSVVIWHQSIAAATTVCWRPPLPFPQVALSGATSLTVTADNGVNVTIWGIA